MSENPGGHRHSPIVERPEAVLAYRGAVVQAAARKPGTDQREDGPRLTDSRIPVVFGLSARWSLHPSPPIVRRARALARDTLTTWNLALLIDDVELLVSELTTNALLHATGCISLHLAFCNHLLCEVGDDEPTAPTPRHPPPGSETGRGLHLVDRLASRWGSTLTQTGKLVWFELQVPADGGQRDVDGVALS